MQVPLFSGLVFLAIVTSVTCLHPTKLTVLLSLTRNVLPTDQVSIFYSLIHNQH